MTPQRWQEIERVFGDAMALSGTERMVFLNRTCGGDAVLRREVESLLDNYDSDPDFLEEPAAKVSDLAGDEAILGDPERIGPYRVIERIGAGGMGTVYLAERDDDQYRKRVAIKLVKRGMDSEQILARFRAERQILASLDHPGIARLFDGGVADDGRPYFVLEYIDEALPIDRYCDAKGLNVAERLGLFRQACDAVQYAHRRLIVHRDLKPQNLLVSKEGQAKLLDFGIAKLLDPSFADVTHLALTRTEMRIMTPDYASPEQVRGEPLSTTSDVYSLGVILYKLLTGKGPYRVASSTPAAMAEAICQQEPDKPSTVALQVAASTEGDAVVSTPAPGRLKGDLDNIVLKALRKEPEARYPSVEALAADIDRFLEHRPVTARPQTAAYRLRRFVERNAVAVGLSMLALMLLVGGLAGTAWQAQQARLERDRARSEAQKAARVADVLADLFDLSSPGQHADANTMTIREFADLAEERVVEGLEDQAEVRTRLQTVMGRMNLDLARYQRSRNLLEAALPIQRELYPEGHSDLADTLNHLGAVAFFQQEYTQARELLEEALAMRRKLLGDGLEVAETLTLLARVRGAAQDSEGVQQAIMEALAIRRRLLEEDHPLIGASLGALAVLHYSKGEYAKAVEQGERALAIQRKAHGNVHQKVAHELNNLGAFYDASGNYTRALETHREALAVRTAVYGPEHPYVAFSLTHLGTLASLLGDPAGAVAPLQRALEIREAAYGRRHHLVGMSLAYLGAALTESREYGRAAELLEEAVEIERESQGEQHAQVANALVKLGDNQFASRQYPEAVSTYREALEIRRQSAGPDHPRTAVAQAALGRALIEVGELLEAESLLDSAVATLEAKFPAGHLDTASAYLSRGDLEDRRRRPAEARVAYGKALEIFEAKLPAGHFNMEKAQARMAALNRARAHARVADSDG